MNALVFQAAFFPLFWAIICGPLPILFLIGYLVFGNKIQLVLDRAVSFGLGHQIGLLVVLTMILVIFAVGFTALSLRHFIVVHLRETGLAARSAHGKLIFIDWDAITRADRINLPFLPLLRIESTNQSTIYLPVFLNGLGVLTRLIPQENLLAQKLTE